MKRILETLLFAAIVLVTGAFETPRTALSNEARSSQIETSNTCLAASDISQNVQKLSGSYSEANSAMEFFLGASKRSSACRSQIITGVMAAMNKSNLDIARDQASNDLWRYGSELLGEMKAVEALDLLISHLDMNDREWTATMSHQPALGGVIRMGIIAIPKLKVVLRSSDVNLRRDAVYCLSFIGGSAALAALREAEPTERDQCVSRFIRVSIRTLENKKTSVKNNEEWFSAFICKN